MFKPKGVMFLTLVIMLMAFSCSGPKSDQTLLTAELPLHLEEHLDAARIEGSEVPEDIPEPVEWRFNEPQPDWKPVIPLDPAIKPVEVTRSDDALRLVLNKANQYMRNPRMLGGAIYIDLPDWKQGDWAYVMVTARAKENVEGMRLFFNLLEQPGGSSVKQRFGLMAWSEIVYVINDGAVHSYLLPAGIAGGPYEDPWKQTYHWNLGRGADKPRYPVCAGDFAGGRVR